MPVKDHFSLSQARRIALAAQGFAAARPERPTLRNLRGTLARSHLFQIDSVNVLVRAHYMPLYSRIGSYDRPLLDAASAGRKRLMFEYWGHEASLIRLDLHPLFRWRMARAAQGKGTYGGLARFGVEKKTFIKKVLREVEASGPISAGELTTGGKGEGSWWGWSDGKRALEWLFWAGFVTTAFRRGFERVYDLPERVLPQEILDMPTPSAKDAQRQLLKLSAQALGIASARCLRDYFRLDVTEAKQRLMELVEAGDILPVTVKGWDEPVYLDPDCRIPRKIEARTLLSPFDPIVWERTRAERLFGFRYRIEIYTPAHKREFGYYCLPFLLGEKLVARVDLKADRAGRRLLVKAVHVEAGADRQTVLRELEDELALISDWLDLEEQVHVGG